LKEAPRTSMFHAAAIVRQRGTDPKGWIEIEYDGTTGWVKKDNILLLYP